MFYFSLVILACFSFSIASLVSKSFHSYCQIYPLCPFVLPRTEHFCSWIIPINFCWVRQPICSFAQILHWYPWIGHWYCSGGHLLSFWFRTRICVGRQGGCHWSFWLSWRCIAYCLRFSWMRWSLPFYVLEMCIKLFLPLLLVLLHELEILPHLHQLLPQHLRPLLVLLNCGFITHHLKTKLIYTQFKSIIIEFKPLYIINSFVPLLNEEESFESPSASQNIVVVIEQASKWRLTKKEKL